jgi:LysR family transcriptional regulator, hydrogen peroxide-inducible genes activator
MNLRDLRYLVAIAEQGHFGRAAKACNVSQPTLSGQVRRLEEFLGVLIFERRAREVVPTDVGRRVLAHARQVLLHADAIEAEARSSHDPLSGPIRLGIIPTLGPYLMPLVFGPLAVRCPALTIELWEDVTPNLIQRLREGGLDAAIIASDDGQGEFGVLPLFTEPFLAVLPPRHPLAGRPVVDADELAGDMLVLADGHCLRDQALAACGREDAAGRALRASSLETLVNMVAAGHGTTLAPVLASAMAASRSVEIVPLRPAIARRVQLISRTTFPKRAALQALAEVVREQASARIGRGAARTIQRQT